MKTLLKRLGRDRRGVSAVEFALIAPAMIAFYFGLAEITQALLAERRAGHAASAIGDLVAQSSTISNTEISDIFQIATTIMQPYPTNTLQMRVTSVKANAAGATTVAWSSGRYFGCKFSAPIATAAVSAALLRSPAPGDAKASTETVEKALIELESLSFAIKRITRVVDKAIDQLTKK